MVSNSEMLQELAGVQDGVVLDGAGNQVVAPVEVGKGRPLQGCVVRFRAAAGENHLARPAIQDLRDGIAGGIEAWRASRPQP